MRMGPALVASLVLGICSSAMGQFSHAEIASRVAAATHETEEVGQTEAERLFASADAAIWFPESRRARWLASSHHIGEAEAAAFAEQLERDYPLFRRNAQGPFLLKMPVTSSRSPRASTTPPVVQAAIFTESFESGMGNWDLDDNTLGLYSWGATSCEARTGTRSADAIRGGANTLTCTSTYAANVNTEMVHKGCEGIQGAAAAWLDAWIHVDTESGADMLAFYYADSAGKRYGYGFSGTWAAWFHVVMNLKQWYSVGDVTAVSCPALSLEFDSDESVESGLGVRVDDITVSNAAPSFLAAAITASPATGPAPLTVSFAPVVTGSSGSPVYQWTFGDPASTTSTSRNPSFVYSTAGDYSVRLRVEETGVRAYAHTVIHVGTAATCSISCSASAPSSAKAGSAVGFQSSATASNCSGTTSYAWQFGDGQTSAAQNPSHTYALAGTYGWSVTATAGGVSCTKSGSVVVTSSTSSANRRRAVSPPLDTSLIATQTIGVSGGTLSGGGFALVVPAGAFSANATLTLSKVGGLDASIGQISDTFRLGGLPGTLGKDLTIEIQLPASAPPLAAGEKYFITIDAPAYHDRNVVTVPFRIPATVSGTKLGMTVPKTWLDVPATATKAHRAVPNIAMGFTGDVRANTLKTVETEHFTASMPSKDYLDTNARLVLFETQFRKLEDMGLSFGCRTDSGVFRRIEVVPIAFGQGGDLGGHVSRNSPCGAGWFFNDYLEITTSYPANDSSVSYGAGHELFHLLQDIYSPGGNRANLWLKEASSIWYEVALGNTCPTVQSGYQQFPWNGLFNSKNSAAGAQGEKQAVVEAHHGYSASYFLDYHSTLLTDPFISLMWQFIKQGQSEVAAMQSAMGTRDLAGFWAEFAKEYFTTGMDEGCQVSWAMFGKEAIANEQYLPRSTRISAHPLSAKSWNLDLRNFSSSAVQPAVLTATGLKAMQSVYAMQVTGKGATPLAEITADSPTYKIDDLNALKGTLLTVVFVDRNLPAGDINAQGATNDVTVSIGPAVPAGVSEVCFDGNLNLQTAETRISSVKHVTRCVKEGESGGYIAVSVQTNQLVSVMAQEQYTDGVWFKIVLNALPMTDSARNRYSASGTALQNLGPVIEYEDKDCSGGYCEKLKLISVDWPTASAWVTGKAGS